MEEIELIDIIKCFWKKKVQIIVIILIFAMIGGIYTFKLKSSSYKSTANLVITPIEVENIGADNQIISTTLNVSINNQLIPTYMELIKSQAIAQKVKENLALDISASEISNKITVANTKNTTILQINVTDKDSDMTVQIANETAKVFIEYVKENYKLENVSLVDEAVEPEKASAVNHTKHLIIFVAIGIIIAAGYVLLIAIFNRKITSLSEVETIAKDIPIIGNIPDYKKIQNGGNN